MGKYKFRFKNSRLGSVLGVTTFAIVLVGALFAFVRPSFAAVCGDPVNIIRCGLDGGSTSTRISSFKKHYNQNSPSDFQAVTNWAGYNKTIINNMNTGNTKAGTLYRNGDVRVGGKLVGRDSWITARYGSGRKGFKHIVSNIWARKTTTEAARDRYPVLVTFNSNGRAIAGVVIDCGNIINFDPTNPADPDVSIEKTVSKSIVKVGEEFNYNIKVTNTGNVTLQNVLVHDQSPQNVQFLRASAGNISSSGNWTYTIPSLAVKGVATFTITAKVTAEVTTAINNTACVNAPSVDAAHPSKDDDCSTVPVHVNVDKPGVSIEKTVSKDEVNVGEEFTYTVKALNTGNIDLKNVVVYDQPNANVALVSADVGTVAADGGKWTYTIPLLKVGETQTFSLTAKVKAYAAGQLYNTACINAPEFNPAEPTKDDACAKVPVVANQPFYSCEGDLVATADIANPYMYNFVGGMKYGNGVKFLGADFTYGDGKTETISKEDPAMGFKSTHTYEKAGSYNVSATLRFDLNGKTVTSQACKATISVVIPYYSCIELTGEPIANVKNGFDFMVHMKYGNGATFSGADIDFGDGTVQKDVKAADAESVKVSHTYPNANEYTISAVLKFNVSGKVVSAAACKALVKPGQVSPECRPGIPVGDVRCNPCKYDARYAADDEENCIAPDLPNTGTGSVIGIGLAAIIGGFLAYKHILLKRHKTALASLANGHPVGQNGRDPGDPVDKRKS